MGGVGSVVFSALGQYQHERQHHDRRQEQTDKPVSENRVLKQVSQANHPAYSATASSGMAPSR